MKPTVWYCNLVTHLLVQWYLGIQLFLATNILAYKPSPEEIFVSRYDKKCEIQMCNIFSVLCLIQ